MKITEISIKKPIMVGMVFLGVILFGFVALTKLQVDLFPDVTLPMMVVMSSYPGAGPEEIETGLTDILEKGIGSVSHLKKITSTTSENVVMIILEFDWGTDLDAVANDVRDNISVIQPFLPEDATQPIIFKFDPSMMPIVMYYLSGAIDPSVLQEIGEDIADQLQRVGGVAGSYIEGGNRDVVQIVIDPLKLSGTGVSVDQITAVLKAQNLNYPLGSVDIGKKVYSLRMVGQYTNLEEIRKTVVGQNRGVPVHLAQVAEVVSQPLKPTSIIRANGEASAMGFVQKKTSANTVGVAGQVVKELNRIKKSLPPGVKVTIAFNQADYINRAVRSTMDTLWLGGLLAVLVLFLFFGNLRATIFVAASIPITVFFTLFLMYLFGMSMNIVSLGGLTIAIGMVVDAAIVVFEAIYRHQQEKGEDPVTAANVGTNEVAAAITGSTLTTVGVFLPLLLVSGLAAVFFTQLAWTVTFALMSSLLVALTILPMFTARWFDVKKMQTSRMTRSFTSVYKKLETLYVRIVTWALHHQKTVIWSTVLVFVISMSLIVFTGFELMPHGDQGEINLTAEMPLGTNLAATDSAIAKLEQIILKEVPENKVLTVSVGAGEGMGSLFGGASGPHAASVNIFLVHREKRKRSDAEIQSMLRSKISTIPGLKVSFITQSLATMFGGGKAIEIKLLGYDQEKAVAFSELLIDSLKTIRGLTDLASDFIRGKPEYRMLIDREKAAGFGLTPYQVGSALRARIEGVVATKYRKSGEEYDIKIRFDDKSVANLERIRTMTIATPVGEVPLRNFLADTVAGGPVSIKHENSQRLITVTGNVENRDLNSVARDVRRRLSKLIPPPGITPALSGSYEQMQSTFRDLGFVIVLSLILVYMIMAAQFESFKEPFIIMFTIPLGLIGVMWALFFTKTTVSMQSLLGVLILGGVVVNNAIVYIDYVNQLRRKEGMSLFDALVEAGRVRLRPILMTALTTIAGLIPMALAVGSGNEMRAPMSRSLIGGLTVATFLTLVVIPVLYMMFEKGKNHKPEV
jgi:HAE1 family hydrophobic/amphiphilic exporter-1